MVSPLGLSFSDSWAAACEGRSGIGPITKFDASNYDTKIAGEVRGFQADLYVPKKEQKKMDLFIQYAVASSQMALEQAGLWTKESGTLPGIAERTGVLIGVGMGGLPTIEEQHQKLLEKGPGRVSPFFIPSVITNMAAGQITIQFGLRGPNYSVTSACASGAHSIGEAAQILRRGDAEVMLAGGSESTVCGLAIAGFSSMRALSSRNDSPEKASRPFDRDRDGFVLAEGAAVLVLETEAHAKKRGAKILGRVLGYGFSSDAFHMTSPAPEGVGAAHAMKMCLDDAGTTPDQVQYVNAHGTSTPIGDELETQALHRVFGAHAKSLMVSSTKSMMGHSLGAAGAIESAFCLGALMDQMAPPTLNLENPGPGCDLDYVPNKARRGEIKMALNNSFGFGGTNACLLFGRG